PIGGLATVLLNATRGFGTITPWVIIDSIGKPLLRLVAVAMVLQLVREPSAATVAWTIPLPLALLAAGIWLGSLLQSQPEPSLRTATATNNLQIAIRFGRTSLPQVVSDIF